MNQFFYSFAVILGLAAATLLLLSPHAHAGDAGAVIEAAAAAPDIAAALGTEINVKDPAAQLVGFILIGLGALLKWGADKLFGVKGKIPLTDDMRKLLDNAIDAALQLAREKLRDGIKDMNNPHILNQTVATALNFVLAAVPSVIDALGYDEAKLEALIEEKLFAKTQAADA